MRWRCTTLCIGTGFLGCSTEEGEPSERTAHTDAEGGQDRQEVSVED